MVERGSSGNGPEVHSGPDDLAFVDLPPRDRLRRSNTMPKKQDGGGIFGFLGNFRKSKPVEPGDYPRPGPHHDGDAPRHTDTEREDRHRRRREDRKQRPPKIETDVEGLTADAGGIAEAEDGDARRAERKARKAAKLAKLEAEHGAREAELRDGEERRARRREEKAKAREERENFAREEEEREEKRREEKRARRATRLAREEEDRRLREEEEGRAIEEEAAREAEAEAKVARRRERRRMKEEGIMVDGDDRNGYRSDRRRSHAPKSRDRNSGDEHIPDHRYRHSHRSVDESRSKRRRSTADDRHARRKSRHMDDVPYPAMVHGGKDKTSSWVNSQMTDPPEVIPLAETVMDVPGGDPHTNSLSSDEDMRRAIHRRKKQNKNEDFTDAELERRARRRESRRAEREAVRSSEGSGDHYDRYGADRYAHANGHSKMSSWFKKLTKF